MSRPRTAERQPAAWRRVPAGAVARFVAFLVLVGTAFVLFRWTPVGGYFSREALLATLGEVREVWWSPLALIALWTFLCPVGLPATPLVVAGGIVFGPLWGSIYNWTGGLLGALVGYFLARSLGADFVHHLLGQRIRRIERQVGRRGFWYLVTARFIPVPFPALNFAMALAGVPAGAFALSSAVGLAPAMVLWTWFWAAFFQAAAGETRGLVTKLALAVGLLLAASLLPQIARARQRRRRYRELTAARRRR